MLRIFAVILCWAKRLDARLTSGVEAHGRCLCGLNAPGLRDAPQSASRKFTKDMLRPVSRA
ncbi:hypothetical protein C7450_117117 [Chelatococcus asaccharovorans]|uniref:Uncharacterized protein n=2 Tax=Chelatococcus asaccharovorans TaxID=28210 RepID=A0A2V3TTG0_9HYPH|nr:hypothetical protein C7450_117117 [Chelatococcus asaccharovorans]